MQLLSWYFVYSNHFLLFPFLTFFKTLHGVQIIGVSQPLQHLHADDTPNSQTSSSKADPKTVTSDHNFSEQTRTTKIIVVFFLEQTQQSNAMLFWLWPHNYVSPNWSAWEDWKHNDEHSQKMAPCKNGTHSRQGCLNYPVSAKLAFSSLLSKLPASWPTFHWNRE